MKLAVISDVHLEFGDLLLPNRDRCDALIIAGDCVVASVLHNNANAEPHTRAHREFNRLHGFIQRCVDEFSEVIAIAGNHEFYHGRWNASLDHLREFYQHYGVEFLERDECVIQGQHFVGCTLWTDMHNSSAGAMQAARLTLNDFKLIVDDTGNYYTRLSPQRTVNRHIMSVEFLRETITKDTVVITHHSPCHLSSDERYAGDILNCCYYTDLSELILDREPKLWIHGHMHNESDYQVGTTRVVCNPRGYVGYEPQANSYTYKIIEI